MQHADAAGRWTPISRSTVLLPWFETARNQGSNSSPLNCPQAIPNRSPVHARPTGPAAFGPPPMMRLCVWPHDLWKPSNIPKSVAVAVERPPLSPVRSTKNRSRRLDSALGCSIRFSFVGERCKFQGRRAGSSGLLLQAICFPFLVPIGQFGKKGGSTPPCARLWVIPVRSWATAWLENRGINRIGLVCGWPILGKDTYCRGE